MIQEYRKMTMKNMEVHYFTMEDYYSNVEIQKHYQELKSWDWNFGQTPYFTQTVDVLIDNQIVKIEITVKHGRIHDISNQSDTKYELITKLKEKWVSHTYDQVIKLLNHK